MCPFMGGKVLLEIELVNPAKRTQKIAYAGPHAFDGVGMHLPDSVAILIARLHPLSRRMTNRDVLTFYRRQVSVGAPLVSVDVRSFLSCCQDRRLQIRSRTVF